MRFPGGEETLGLPPWSMAQGLCRGMAGIWAQQGLIVLLRTASSTLTSGWGYSSVTEKDSACLACAMPQVQVPEGENKNNLTSYLSLPILEPISWSQLQVYPLFMLGTFSVTLSAKCQWLDTDKDPRFSV